jgi:hypothetical protein
MRDALEIVVRLTQGGEDRRDQISKMIFRIADQITFDATALANLTLSEMAARHTGGLWTGTVGGSGRRRSS